MRQWVIYYGLLALGAALGIVVHALCMMAGDDEPAHEPRDTNTKDELAHIG